MLLCSYIWLQSGKMLLDLSPVLEDGLTAEQVVEEASRVAGLLTARQSTLVQFIGRPSSNLFLSCSGNLIWVVKLRSFEMGFKMQALPRKLASVRKAVDPRSFCIYLNFSVIF